MKNIADSTVSKSLLQDLNLEADICSAN